MELAERFPRGARRFVSAGEECGDKIDGSAAAEGVDDFSGGAEGDWMARDTANIDGSIALVGR